MTVEIISLPSPPIRHVLQTEQANPDIDGDFYWQFIRSYLAVLNVDGKRYEVTIPEGFVSDGGSIPRLTGYLRGLAFRAYFLHDYLYHAKILTRKQADEALEAALLFESVSAFNAEQIYLGVRIGGASHWA